MSRGLIALLLLTACAYAAVSAQVIGAPRIWDDAQLEEWATPVAGLDVRPAHYSSAEYYAVPPDNLRTYPFYPANREPAGYWEWLQKQKPEPLVDPNETRSREAWIAAGSRAFQEVDALLIRSDDPALIARARDPQSFPDAQPLADGSLPQLRWVVTSKGLMLSAPACSQCHTSLRSREGGRSDTPDQPRGAPLLTGARATLNRLTRFYADDTLPIAMWKEFTVPWAPDSRVERFKSMTVEDVQALNSREQLGRSFQGGVFARANGSLYYTTKIPDLRDLRFSRYLDATATHQLRGPEDIARYAALVTGADRMEFGTHRILSDSQRRLRFRYADEVLYAIGMYLMSLDVKKNPDEAPADVLVRGEQVFGREKCARCHPAPEYTTGKLTLAEGWSAPADHPYRHDIMPVSVGTDSGAALKTRKGTGLYKIPSLRGVWSRRRLLHDGSLTTLEELFDAARLEPDYQPAGWNPPGVTRRPVRGHELGLSLSPEEKKALIAFLRSL